MTEDMVNQYDMSLASAQRVCTTSFIFSSMSENKICTNYILIRVFSDCVTDFSFNQRVKDAIHTHRITYCCHLFQ
jgi:hypothetical protein